MHGPQKLIIRGAAAVWIQPQNVKHLYGPFGLAGFRRPIPPAYASDSLGLVEFGTAFDDSLKSLLSTKDEGYVMGHDLPVKRLDQKIGSPSIVGPTNRVRVAFAGDYDDGCPFTVDRRSHLGTSGQSVEPRHVQIQQNKIEV